MKNGCNSPEMISLLLIVRVPKYIVVSAVWAVTFLGDQSHGPGALLADSSQVRRWRISALGPDRGAIGLPGITVSRPGRPGPAVRPPDSPRRAVTLR